ncbi:PREDICTED: non-specific lipid-transfer protein 2 [Populus euphratica]|uniref:Non-specific lipid-transfer protein 2 n=1 Tax=Populus euphratica TaxID=75702 RepID=A0AAJ6U114_POPEU|nr:PREDICTED: non-specific lipid-transfer protein 2 [Populus euphratica]
MKMASFFMIVMVVTTMLLAEAQVSQAETCNPEQLSPCLGAITSSTPPSTTCCSKLKEQKPCLCGYLKDPSLKQYVSSPGARKVVSACGVPYPSC